MTCKARAEENLQIARQEFSIATASPESFSLADVAKIYPKLDELIRWAKDIKEYALLSALDGKTVPGYKVVLGREVRKWKADAEPELQELVPEKHLYKKTMVGIGAIEKILGKKHPIFGCITEKPPGKPVLVPVTDKREEYNEAKQDFKEIIDAKNST